MLAGKKEERAEPFAPSQRQVATEVHERTNGRRAGGPLPAVALPEDPLELRAVASELCELHDDPSVRGMARVI